MYFFFFLLLEVAEVFGFFFFQAEDGIRDDLVTGVQTCALPISCRACARPSPPRRVAAARHGHDWPELRLERAWEQATLPCAVRALLCAPRPVAGQAPGRA